MPRFLSVVEVEAIHSRMLADHGGSPGIRNAGGIAAAVAMPQQTYGGDLLHEFPFEMAAAYAFHIAESQGYVDGNKRTGATAALVFLALNGWECAPGPWVTEALLGVAAGTLSKKHLASVFARHATKMR